MLYGLLALLSVITFKVGECNQSIGDSFSCEKKPHDNEGAAICSDITSIPALRKCIKCASKRDADTLFIRNVLLDPLNLSGIEWGQLQSLIIYDSHITKVKGLFRGQLKNINLTSLSIQDIDPKAFLELKSLETLDLSNNNLTNLPNLPSPSETLKRNFTLDISDEFSGNRFLKCHSVIDLIGSSQYSRELQFLNDNLTICLSSRSFNWFNSTEVVPLFHIIMSKKLEKECPKSCHCSPYRVDLLPGQLAAYAAKVDCSGQKLSKLPFDLPPNTRLLNVTNNNITSLDKLSVDPLYRDIREFYADNNQIESITVLEGSYFIDHFVILSLRDNNLKTIPTYILSNAFDRNRRAQNIKLGGNRLNCDCNAAQGLKMWLMTNKAYIPDYEEVLCEGDLDKVIFLDQNKVCRYKKEWTDYIYYIIAGEIFLLVCIISKLIYDYYIFKSKGYLPWPASKMPKLPCEWVFES